MTSDSDLNDWYSYGPGRAETAGQTARPISSAEQKKAEKRTDKSSKRLGRRLKG